MLAPFIIVVLILGSICAYRMRRMARLFAELRRVHAALDNATIGIGFIDRDGRLAMVNGSVAATLGYTVQELAGSPFGAHIHPDDLRMVHDRYTELRENGRAEFEIRAIRKDGELVPLRGIVTPSLDERGKLLGHYCFERDISAERTAREALQRSEERFHLATRASSNIVFEWNLKTNACWCNEAMEETFGFPTSGDVDISVWRDALHPDDLDRVMGRITDAIAAGERSWSDEYRFRRGDNGMYLDVLSHAYMVYGADGDPLRMIGTTMDITDRKRAERAYNTQILNAAADGIFGFDVNGVTVFANQSAARLLGRTVDEVVGRNLHDIAHSRHADGTSYPWCECPAFKTLQTGEALCSDQEVFWRPDGTSFPVEYEVTAIRDADGSVTGAVVTFRDITERRGVERMKDEFVSVVSHELRTPLTSIRAALGLLAAGRLGEVPQTAKRMLDVAVSNTDRLVRLINDILDIERLDSGGITLALAQCDANDLMSQVVDTMKTVAEKADVRIEWTRCKARFCADRDRLVQTLTNLVSNAVKFSPPGTVVSLAAKAERDEVRFEVADRGRGIPSDKLEIIFERFKQVDASDSREKGGTGLGLAICRSIVRQHGGKIWAESEAGQGSRVCFTIPRKVAA